MSIKTGLWGWMSLGWLCVGILLAPGLARAQDAPWLPRLELEVGTLQGEQFSDDKGEYNVNRSQASVSFYIFKLSMEDRHYDWDQERLGELPFGNGQDRPWKHLHRLELSAAKELAIGQHWSLFLEAGALAAYEEDFNGLGGRLRTWGGYSFSPGVRLRLGGQVQMMQDGPGVLIPELALDLNKDQALGFSASLGVPDAHLQYAFCPWAALRLAGWLDWEVYQLGESSTVRQEGFLETQRYMSGLFLDLRPLEGLRASLGLVRSWGGEMTTYDKDGDNDEDYDLEGAWGGALTLSYQF